MQIANDIIEMKTKSVFDITDITDQVEKILAKSRVKNGLISIQSMHTTAAVLVNEKESQLWKDLCAHLDRIASAKNQYFHDDFTVRTENMCDDECKNGHSHCKAIHLPTSVTMNVVDGKIAFGRWQRILFIELDESRDRKISISVLGDSK